MRRKIGRKQRLLKRRSTYKRARQYRRENTGHFKLYKSVTNAITCVAGAAVPFSQYLPVDVTTFTNWVEISGLYDQYKIDRIRITLRPKFKSIDSNATQANWNAYVYSIIDRDNVPTTTLSRSIVVGYRNRKTTRYSQAHSRSFIPSITQQMSYYDTSGTVLSTVKPAYGYCDTIVPVTINNMYVYIDPVSSDCPTTDLTWDVDYTVHITCKTYR